MTATGQYTSYHEWTLDAADLQQSDLSFPDLKVPHFVSTDDPTLDRSIGAREEVRGAEGIPAALLDKIKVYGQLTEELERLIPLGGQIRRGIRGDAEARAMFDYSDADWKRWEANDRELRPAWLAGLRQLNVTLTPPKTPWASAPPEVFVTRGHATATAPTTRP